MIRAHMEVRSGLDRTEGGRSEWVWGQQRQQQELLLLLLRTGGPLPAMLLRPGLGGPPTQRKPVFFFMCLILHGTCVVRAWVMYGSCVGYCVGHIECKPHAAKQRCSPRWFPRLINQASGSSLYSSCKAATPARLLSKFEVRNDGSEHA